MIKNDQIISEYISSSAQETKDIGRNIAKKLKKQAIVAFIGNLGSGKTTLIKGLASSINSSKEELICSPTFTYLNIYPGNIDIYHFDLYRIQDEKQFLAMGFEEYFDKNGICLIEWSEKITSLLPSHTLVIHMIQLENENERKITVLEL